MAAEDGMMPHLLPVTPQIKISWGSKISVDWEGGTLKVLTPAALIMGQLSRKSGQDLDDIAYLKELIDEA